jgi:hypothetical protein
LTRNPNHNRYFPEIESRDVSHLLPYQRTLRKYLGYKEHGAEPARDYRKYIEDPEGNKIKTQIMGHS